MRDWLFSILTPAIWKTKLKTWARPDDPPDTIARIPCVLSPKTAGSKNTFTPNAKINALNNVTISAKPFSNVDFNHKWL